MENINHKEDKLVLNSPDGFPYQFEIITAERDSSDQRTYAFYITANGSEKTEEFNLPDREHHSFLDFFDRLSKDFGLRRPQNRKNVKRSNSIPNPNYCEVLTSNLSPKILYGYGDPAIIKAEFGEQSIYYLIATSNDAPNSFPILRSSDLKNWELVHFVFPEGQKPSWAADGKDISDYWAAEMHQVNNEFRVYFVARDKVSSELCIGMAKSPHPEGPFEAGEKAILTGNVIDPHVFVHDGDTAYLYWKEDNNDLWPGQLIDLLYNHPRLINHLFEEEEDRLTASFTATLWPWARTLPPMERFFALQLFIESVIARYAPVYSQLETLNEQAPVTLRGQLEAVLKYMKTPMYAQKLSRDGTQLLGERTQILENDLAWEAHLVEGMWVTQYQGNYYLFYAGNDFSTDKYGIGVAIGKSPLGPFEKMESPVLQSTEKWWAPGHPSVVAAPNGTLTMFLHAYFPGKAGYKEFRALLSIPLNFEDGGISLA